MGEQQMSESEVAAGSIRIYKERRLDPATRGGGVDMEPRALAEKLSP
jgi:hypothetical protein